MKRPLLIVVLMVVFLVIDLVLTGLLCGLSAGDWGTWIGAIGTIGAFIGTIWIAGSESRRKHHQELVIARITFAGMVPMMNTLQAQIGKIVQGLRKPIPDGESINFVRAAEMIEVAGIWTNQDLLSLSPLPCDASAQLAAVSAHIRNVLHLFKTSATNSNLQSRESQAEFGLAMARLLDMARSAIIDSAKNVGILVEIEFQPTVLDD